MPVYEYECKSCKRTIESMQRFDDPPLQSCEFCGGELRKLISNTSFVLKGNGWYVTDYARKSTGDPEGVKDKNEDAGDRKTGCSESKESGHSEKVSATESNKTESASSSDVSSEAAKSE